MGSKAMNNNLLNAAKKGDTDSVDEMASEGADVDTTDINGRTGLWFAASNNDRDMVQMLFKHGADANQEDNDGITPLIKALEATHWHLARQLLERADINHQGGDTHFTALHSALNLDLKEEGTQRVEFVMKNGGNAKIANSQGLTALDLARTHGKTWPHALKLAELIEEYKDGAEAREKYLAEKRDRGIVENMRGTSAPVQAPGVARFTRLQR